MGIQLKLSGKAIKCPLTCLAGTSQSTPVWSGLGTPGWHEGQQGWGSPHSLALPPIACRKGREEAAVS